jgi:hypothetical protein
VGAALDLGRFEGVVEGVLGEVSLNCSRKLSGLGNTHTTHT